MKAKLIILAVKIIMGAIALGLGIWYISNALGGASLTYSSMGNFLNAIGAENGDIATANGCFMCRYIADLFAVIGDATEMFWNVILDSLLVLMAVGFGIYIAYTAIEHVWAATKKTAGAKVDEKTIDFKSWFDKIWKQGIRIFIVIALLGGGAMGGAATLRAISQITITPVLFVGTELGMAASGISDAATCAMTNVNAGEILSPVMGSFMCIIGNINSVMLAGAAGGFAMMNYSWLGMGGGAFTWIAGLALVIMFLVIGFDLFFQILSVVFKLIFLIIFMPIFVASYAFEGAWKLAGGLVNKAINMLINAAIKIVVITLKVVIIYATVAYAADSYFPGPVDGYSVMLPPMMGQMPQNPDAQTLSVMNVFSECEKVALSDGEMDKDKFKSCFTAQSAMVERTYPGAFDFLRDGWDFLVLMGALFALYFLVLRNRIEGMLPSVGGEDFDFGGQIKQLGKNIWSIPKQIANAVGKAMDEKVI
ncbi:MAG: hypothetical protein IKA08_01525 [Alphaproteobacteria bacterium]|nr:hypothetical protein [Alphaproteobacteria bacterium]